MKEIVIYVHGKGGSVQEAEHYKTLFPNCEVIGFDYRSQTPWEATEEFPGFFAAVRKRCEKLTLVANSIGAFFSLSALNEKLVDTSFFISPVVDMEQLICNMMQWAGISESRTCRETGNSHHIWRNSVVGISLLCPGASDLMENPYAHFVWGKG